MLRHVAARAARAVRVPRGAHAARAMTQAAAPPAGLYGVPWLTAPERFHDAAVAAEALSRQLVAAVEAASGDVARVAAGQADAHDAAVGILHRMDALSNILCQVLDAAECCRNSHRDEEWRAAAGRAYETLGGFLYQLNVHRPLYDAVAAVSTAPPPLAGALTPEQHRMADSLRTEFERDGIHLPDGERARTVQLNSDVQAATTAFVAAISALCAAPSTLTVPAAEVEGLPVWGTIAPYLERQTGWPATYKLPLGEPVVSAILEHAPDARLRRRVLEGVRAHGAGNLEALHTLRDLRTTTARALGFDSWAAFISSHRTARTPAAAIDFLVALSHAVAPKALAELAALADDKRAFEAARSSADGGNAADGGSSADSAAAAAAAPRTVTLATDVNAPCCAPPVASASTGDCTPDGACSTVVPVTPAASPAPAAPLTTAQGDASAARGLEYLARARATRVNAWDLQFHMGRVDRDALPLGAADAALPYFTVNNVLVGVEMVAARVFGVRMARRPVEGIDQWDLPSHQRRPAAVTALLAGGLPATSTILRYDVTDAASDAPLGVVYVDPYASPHKRYGAAHFTVQGGKLGGPHDGALAAALTGLHQPLQDRQQPIVVVTSTAGSRTLPDGTAVVTMREAETLFHEFGHALNSLLSRTEFQHLSGTRGALDFVEVPSHLMEHWARDYRVVREFARHPKTGDAMPEDLFEALQRSARRFSGIAMQEQIVLALLDLGIHGGSAAVDRIMAASPRLYEALTFPDGMDTPVAEALARGGAHGDAITLPPAPPAAAARAAASLPPLSTSERRAWHRDTAALAAAITHGYSTERYIDGTAAHALKSHLATYGGGYYSYLYAAVMSSALWDRYFAANPWDAASGATVRHQLLQVGAARDAKAIMDSLLGPAIPLAPALRALALAP